MNPRDIAGERKKKKKKKKKNPFTPNPYQAGRPSHYVGKGGGEEERGVGVRELLSLQRYTQAASSDPVSSLNCFLQNNQISQYNRLISVA